MISEIISIIRRLVSSKSWLLVKQFAIIYSVTLDIFDTRNMQNTGLMSEKMGNKSFILKLELKNTCISPHTHTKHFQTTGEIQNIPVVKSRIREISFFSCGMF